MKIQHALPALLSAALMFAAAMGADAQAEPHEDAGTRAAAFLNMESGGRAAALAGAYTGLADDADGIFWNPSALSMIENKELAATYHMSFGGVNHSSAAYAQKLSNGGAFGVAFQGVFGEIERRAADTLEPDSSFTPGEFAFGIGYAHAFNQLSVGASAKAIQQRFDLETNAGPAFDIGAAYRLDRLTIGASALNIGPALGDSDLPTTLRAGVSFRVAEEGPTLAADVALPSGDYASARLGIEHWFFDQIALRGGYRIVEGDNPAKGFSAGIGLKSVGSAPLENAGLQLDYAFVPEDGVGDAHRISLVMSF